ncbi:hypothetical protein HMI51_42055, partial [Corallococcus coralloides]|nr:hypothetical protein [Corallococcus coralloides]
VYGYDTAGQLTHTGDGHGAGHHPAAGAITGATTGPETGAVVRARMHYDLAGRLVARVAVRLPAPGASAGTGAKPAGDGAESPTADAHAVLQIQRFVHGPSGALMQAKSWQAELPHMAAPMAQLPASTTGQGGPASRPMSLAERWLALDTLPLLAVL